MYGGALRGHGISLFAALVFLMATGVVMGQTSPPQYFEGTGHWYRVVTTQYPLRWTAYADSARAGGGYLAAIGSQDENEFIGSLAIAEGVINAADIGGSDAESEGTWKWVAGDTFWVSPSCLPLKYCNWGPGEPNNANEGEDYNHIWTQGANTGQWNDGPDSNGSVSSCVVEYNFNPDSSAWCDDFEDGTGWQSRWVGSQGYQTPVGSPTHSGSGALEFHGSCHSSIYRKNFSASIGEYSAWVNQQHNIAHFEIQTQVNPVDNYIFDGEAYRLELSAQNSSGGLFNLVRSRGGVQTVLATGESTFLLGEWIKVFINRKPEGVIEGGYVRNDEIHTISAADPDPIEAPGGFYLWACSDVPPYTYFDDACYQPLPPSTLSIGQPDCLVSVNHNRLSIPIYLNNHDTLKAMDVPLQYDWPFDPDSISFVGTRVHDFAVKIRSIDAVNKKIRIALIADDGGSGLVLPPVDGATANIPIAKIMFHLPYQCSQEMIGAPDTCTLVLPGDNLQSLKVVDNHDVGYVPGLERDETKVLRYKPGDCNGDDNIDISDAVCIISYIFSGGTPACLLACDCNCGGMTDISDVVYLIAYIFSGGSMPGASLVCAYAGPYAKLSVGSAELRTYATSTPESNVLSLTGINGQPVAGLQLEFSVTGDIEITDVRSSIPGMDVFSGTVDGLFRVGLLDMTGKAVIPAGQHDVVTISYASTSSAQAGDEEIKLVNAIVVGEDANKMNVTITNKGVTSNGGESSALPEAFSLSQNIPNPFNPITEIAYSIPKPTKVKIEVLNILGQSVRTLVDDYKAAGNYSVVWDGRDNSQQSVASGVYLYRIAAGEYAETRKMVLMK